MTAKPRIDGAIIRSIQRRIAIELRDTVAINDSEAERKRDVLLPAAKHLDDALVQMELRGTDPEAAMRCCIAALDLLGEHDELQAVIRDLDNVTMARVNYVP